MSGALIRPYRLDELAAINRRRTAVLSLDELPRFVEALALDQPEAGRVECVLEPVEFRENRVDVSGRLQAIVWVQCQRCLEPVSLDLHPEFSWSFASGGDDTGAGTESGAEKIDLLSWVEDELLLSLPQYPAHAQGACSDGVLEKYSSGAERTVRDSTTPFADLKNLLSAKKSP